MMPLVILKPAPEGARLNGVSAELATAMPLIMHALTRYGMQHRPHDHVYVITSVVRTPDDAAFTGPNSKHNGHALDIGWIGFGQNGDTPQGEVAALAFVLQDEFDVVLEEDHIHIEWHPKRATPNSDTLVEV